MSTDTLVAQPNTIVWTPVLDSGDVKFVTVLDNGVIAGIGTDQRIYTRNQLTSRWNPPVSGGFHSVNVMPSNLLVAVGLDRKLYVSIPLGVNWTNIPDSGFVSCAAVARDGSFVGVGVGAEEGVIYTRKTFMTTDWEPYSQQLPNQVGAQTVAVLSNGTWACVSTMNQLYLLQKDAWVLYPSTVNITSVSLLSVNGVETLLASGTDLSIYTTPYPL